MDAIEFVKRARAGEIDIAEHTAKVLEKTQAINKEYNYLNTISESLAKKQAEDIKKGHPKDGRLLGLPVSIKDSICVRGVESTAGSKVLKGYIPKLNATCVQNVMDEGGIIIGKNSQDEFGFGVFSVNVGIGFKIPKNPFDKERACGGSSGGGAGLTQKADFPHISLGESTGGSIVTPASFCGVAGLCPTYGRVSRWGLIDYGNSLDKVGPFGKTVAEVALGMEVIAGHDPKDSTSLSAPVDNYSDYLRQDIKGMKLGVIKECFGEGVDDSVSKGVWDGIKKLESEGAKYEEISLPLAGQVGLEAYYLIAMSEASTNLAKYCGMRYGAQADVKGSFNEYFSRIRAENLGNETKRRIIIGTFARMSGYRDAYYMKAMKVRTKIIEEYKKALKRTQVLVSPTVPVLPPKFSDIEKMTPLQNYMMDVMTVSPNLAGLPHMNITAGNEKGLPVGMLLIADHLMERKLIQAASWVER